MLSAESPEQVLPVLLAVQAAVEAGCYAAGFLAYEAAPGLDRAFKTHDPSGFPLVWMALFDAPVETGSSGQSPSGSFQAAEWEPSISAATYGQALGAIKTYLRDGDTYQVNYTLRLRASFTGDPETLFARLCRT